MSSLISPSNLQGIGTAAFNTYQQTASALAGNPKLVHFLDGKTGSCIFQFDAVINETHGNENQVTTFPVEDGSTVTDHIIVSPTELTVQGIITDTPIGSKSALLQEVAVTGATIVAPPLIIAAAGTAYAYGAHANAEADKGTASPSVTAFNKLLLLQNGDPTSTPPVPPTIMTVHTQMRRYPNMAIKSLSVPRDRTVSNAIVVQVGLVQLNIVQPQTLSIAAMVNPEVAAKRVDEGQKRAKPSEFDRGRAAGIATGRSIEKGAGSVVNFFGGGS